MFLDKLQPSQTFIFFYRQFNFNDSDLYIIFLVFVFKSSCNLSDTLF